MTIVRLLLAAFLLAIPFAGQASAHQTSLSYVRVQQDGTDITADIRMSFLDLEVAVGIDRDFDGRITWGETKASLDRISAYAVSRTNMTAGAACVLNRQSAAPIMRNGESYLSLGFAVTCLQSGQPVDVSSTLFLDVDPTSRVLVNSETGETRRTFVLGAGDAADTTLMDEDAEREGSFVSYFAEGLAHLFGGPDHMLFLLVLIVPAIYAGRSVRAAALAVLLPITGFTLGHALTLTSAASGLVRPPTQIVEALIALTILLTAIDNVRRFIPGPRSALAFVFGLIHGFGFASALGVLDLSGFSMATALLGFNLGIEAGQVALALAVAPLLFFLREPARRYHVMPFGVSLLAGAMATFWIVERTFLA